MTFCRTAADTVCIHSWQNPHPGLASSAWLQFCSSNLSPGNSGTYQTACEVRTEGAEAVNHRGVDPAFVLSDSVAQMGQCLLRSQEPLYS